MTSPCEVEENVKYFLKSIPENITLIGVTKNIGIEDIKKAVSCGLKNIGENKVQEALDKYIYLKQLNLKWHLIGHLQTNKVKKAVEIFDLIHSVDSLKLANIISKEAKKFGKRQEVLLQVNVSGEETKSGFSLAEIENILPEMSKLNSIMIRGLMTIGPGNQNKDFISSCFKSLKELNEKINKEKYFNHKLDILSMGMTNDYKLAVEEGSTMIRIGRAIFGERN